MSLPNSGQLRDQIRHLLPTQFEELALQVFQFQAQHNLLYRDYLELLGVDARQVQRLVDVPFLPIQLFKKHAIQTGQWQPVAAFASSGTTGRNTSTHLVRDLQWYTDNALRGFAPLYGDLAGYCLLALLPAYLERSDSSLVYMVEQFIRRTGHPASGFFLHDFAALDHRLRACQAQQQPTILLGVSFALLDFAAEYPRSYPELIVMETGGMKGRRREITRAALHAELQAGFGIAQVHAEYGMTELLSQAYAPAAGWFQPAPTLRAMVRSITDPREYLGPGKTGALNLIDLANLDTIAFIATEDLGRHDGQGRFEVLGRLDDSDIRGCNLLVS